MNAMGALGTTLWWLVGAALAVLAQRHAVRGVRTVMLAREPLSGEHTDSCVYHRSLWALDRPDGLAALGLVAVSGVLAAAALQSSAWLLVPAELIWLGVLVWDLWTWERAAGCVKFVSWRRGWQQSTRRVAVSELREVHVSERYPSKLPAWLPARLRPGTCSLTLVLREGKAIKLPRTGTLFGGDAGIEDFANFIRMQMDVVADNRRRAAAEKRALKRQAMELPPAHPATRLDHQALPTLHTG
ncbi:MAG TPA: hypothetical protein VLI72_00670 [Methylibium sp.]|nr:hypothetical protein [Methylibium sp.]